MATSQSSQTSLSQAPDHDLANRPTRRILLLIYIHGFMGDETSFRSFPAHVHSLVTVLLQDTHTVYSKIYPRYRSKRHISNARDDFSKWLSPHESDETDVILLGHSMGGLLSAEVVLMPSHYPDEVFKHTILGTVNFDVPFLGMHHGVVSSGLASLFLPASEGPADNHRKDETASTANVKPTIDEDGTINLLPSDTFWKPSEEDQTFNARFDNDVILPARKFWEGVQHFVHKHSSDLTGAATNLVTSHMEFMSAMSDAAELRQRYTKIRLLEVDNPKVRKGAVKAKPDPPRVRFVNFYTASTGRPKPVHDHEHQKSPDSQALQEPEATTLEISGAVAPSIEDKIKDGAESDKPNTVESSEAMTESATSQAGSHTKPRKDRKFCNLPPKDASGERDPTWVRIYMQDVDEVGAHCGMFFVDDRYERLVAAAAERIEGWAQEAMSLRLVETGP